MDSEKLTWKQSAELIRLGVDESFASESFVSPTTNPDGWGGDMVTEFPIFTNKDLVNYLVHWSESQTRYSVFFSTSNGEILLVEKCWPVDKTRTKADDVTERLYLFIKKLFQEGYIKPE